MPTGPPWSNSPEEAKPKAARHPGRPARFDVPRMAFYYPLQTPQSLSSSFREVSQWVCRGFAEVSQFRQVRQVRGIFTDSPHKFCAIFARFAYIRPRFVVDEMT